MIGQPIILVLLGIAAIVAFFMLLIPVLRGVFWFIGHIFTFIGRTIGDSLRILGGALTSVIFVPLVLLNIVIGRWSAARHFGTAIQDELAGMGYAAYRLVIGNPADLLGIRILVLGIEQRVPEAMAKAPGRDNPARRNGSFDGYSIVGSIAAGGSGAKLYVAEPDEIKRASFARKGLEVDQVVIKSFSVKEGSSLPQIVRESRALEAAKKVGLVLEHSLDEQRFYYVMPYVPGEGLGEVGRRLHEQAGTEGLVAGQMRQAMEYTADLLETLEQYHRNGLWHKDVKPDNIIIHDERAHLVDLGLVTPLRSAMTLTTHGTEYFRDPELVRMALKGVKVHEVNGVKFDIYAAGAVLYSIVENSFPAHGGLSHITKNCPEVVRWVIRRSMTEYDRRYNTANQMLTDLRAIIASDDINTMKPAELPSMRNGAIDEPVMAAPDDAEQMAQAAPMPPAPQVQPAANFTPEPISPTPAATPGPRVRPSIAVANWWTGRYTPSGKPKARMPMQPNAGVDVEGFVSEARHTPRVPRDRRAPAHEQLRNAQKRAAQARKRVALGRHSPSRPSSRNRRYSNGPNKGVGIAVFAAIFILALALAKTRDDNSPHAQVSISGTNSKVTTISPRFDDDGVHITLNGQEMTAEQAHEIVVQLQEQFGSVAQSVFQYLPDQVRDNLQQVRDEIRSNEQHTTASATSRETKLEPATWVVLNDLGDGAPSEIRDQAAMLQDTLASAGWTLVTQGETPESIDLLASLRTSIGTVQPGDPEVKQRLESWLGSSGAAADGVLWFPAATDSQRLRYRFYPRQGAEIEPAVRLARRALND